MLRSEGVIRSEWKEFNQLLSQGEVGDKFRHEVTKVEYLPIMQASLLKMDTLNTVVKKCQHVATVLGQQETIGTVQQISRVEVGNSRISKETYRTTRRSPYIYVFS